MKRYLSLVVFFFLPIIANENTEGFLHKLGNACKKLGSICALPFTTVANHYVEVGKSVQAAQDMEKSQITIQQHSQIIENAQLQTEAIKQVATATADVAVAGKQQTECLEKGFDILGKYETVKAVGQVVGIVSGSLVIAKAGIDVYHYMNPSEEEKAAKKIEHQQNVERSEYLTARRAMNRCLVHNAHGVKDKHGLPVNCHSQFDLFAEIAGNEALVREQGAFKSRL